MFVFGLYIESHEDYFMFFKKDMKAFGMDESGQMVAILLTVIGTITAVLGLLVFSETVAAINTTNISAGALSIVNITPLILAMFGVFVALVGLVALIGGVAGRR